MFKTKNNHYVFRISEPSKSQISGIYLDNDGQDNDGDEHHDKGIDEPGDPMDSIAETHDLHHFLQPILFLVDNTFTDHSHRQNPGQNQKERQGTRYSVNKPR